MLAFVRAASSVYSKVNDGLAGVRHCVRSTVRTAVTKSVWLSVGNKNSVKGNEYWLDSAHFLTPSFLPNIPYGGCGFAQPMGVRPVAVSCRDYVPFASRQTTTLEKFE